MGREGLEGSLLADECLRRGHEYGRQALAEAVVFCFYLFIYFLFEEKWKEMLCIDGETEDRKPL